MNALISPDLGADARLALARLDDDGAPSALNRPGAAARSRHVAAG